MKAIGSAALAVTRVYAWLTVRLLPLRLVRKVQAEIDRQIFLEGCRSARRKS